VSAIQFGTLTTIVRTTVALLFDFFNGLLFNFIAFLVFDVHVAATIRWWCSAHSPAQSAGMC
jgi:hypothetical protein